MRWFIAFSVPARVFGVDLALSVAFSLGVAFGFAVEVLTDVGTALGAPGDLAPEAEAAGIGRGVASFLGDGTNLLLASMPIGGASSSFGGRGRATAAIVAAASLRIDAFDGLRNAVSEEPKGNAG
ncbi:hypothetical protein BJ875DRAFT_457191 [Amylocarpus encephaloides]|uniref:Uncharacterized protein n=1 Tax=Amylocarpus encephaloides TaxID=45428 RepID=A0A9P8C6Z0_9HELO|nr:hypothetical protein BJ875DRAFT_457191 [Amylocarpus encephaloides]